MDITIGSIITNGSSAMRVTERVTRDPRWKAPGWRGENIGLGVFDGNIGMTSFVPDYLLSGWREVPFDWSPNYGGTEERYVWAPDYSRLIREVRQTPTTS